MCAKEGVGLGASALCICVWVCACVLHTCACVRARVRACTHGPTHDETPHTHHHTHPLPAQDNEFILTGYRGELGFKDTLLSVWALHNETGNIWTHLLGASACAAWLQWLCPRREGRSSSQVRLCAGLPLC